MLLYISFLFFAEIAVAFNFYNTTSSPWNPYRSPSNCIPSRYNNYCRYSSSGSCRYRSYTAIGDSYSAGLNYASGLLPDCDGSGAPCNGGDVCLRNTNAFPMLMQKAHNFPEFNFIACSGANTTDCDQSQVETAAYDHPDLVSVTIGGDNNQAFLGLIVNCVYEPDDTYCQYAIENAEYTVSTISPYLTTLFSDITSKALSGMPRPRVVVLSYPRLWSTTNGTACQSDTLAAVPPADRQTMNDLALQMNAALKTASDAAGFVYVDTDALFEGNRLCDNTTTPYFQYDFGTALYGVFHPTEVGQQLFYNALSTGAGC